MVCLAIPTLRPLYLRRRGISVVGYGDRPPTHASDPDLPQFTMITTYPADQKRPDLDLEQQQQQQRPPSPVTLLEEKLSAVAATLAAVAQSEPISFLRDSSSSSSLTMVEGMSSSRASSASFTSSVCSSSPSSPGPEPELEPESGFYHYLLPARPESAHTRRRSDSVDDILGLYNTERSRSRSRGPAIRTSIAMADAGEGEFGHDGWMDPEGGRGAGLLEYYSP